MGGQKENYILYVGAVCQFSNQFHFAFELLGAGEGKGRVGIVPA